MLVIILMLVVILLVCFAWEINNAIEMPDDFDEHDLDNKNKENHD